MIPTPDEAFLARYLQVRVIFELKGSSFQPVHYHPGNGNHQNVTLPPVHRHIPLEAL
jgi:hypothetical protein